jgi:hypothetical protein
MHPANLVLSLKPEMWAPLAAELGIPWRAAEAMHWQIGEVNMAHRAGVVPFSLAATSPSATLPPGHPLPGAYGGDGARSGYGGGERPGARPGARRGPGGLSPGANPPLGPRLEPSAGGPSRAGTVLPSLAEMERGTTAYDGAGLAFGRYADERSRRDDRTR